MMREFIEEKLTIMKEEYRKNPIRIYSDYNKEREALESYHGRELLELLQNADDELRDDMKKEIYVSFKNDILTIANYGDPFNEDGIISLMYSNASEKKNRKKLVIGNKGTGFRAILGWAKEITIHSADLHVRFSRTHAQNVLKALFSDNIGAIANKKAATLVFPEWIDAPSLSDYTTVISIKIKDDESVRNDIIKQIQTLNEDLLLFMNRTQALVIELDEQIIKYEKSEIEKNIVNLRKYVDSECVYNKDWLLNSMEGTIAVDDEQRGYSIVIAYDCEGSVPSNQVIYSYFPTDVHFPFPVLLHANFELNADRNHLIKGSAANKEILNKATELLIDTARKVNKGKISYDIIGFLIKQENLQAELVSYEFEEMLIEKIKGSMIFPTVNKKYVCFSEELIFYRAPLAKYLSGTGFENLLLYCDDEDIQDFVKKLGTKEWYVSDAVEKINAWVKRHKVTEEHIRHVAYTAVAYIDEYEHYSTFVKPHFFYNQDGQLCETNRTIFYLSDDQEITKPPKFFDVDFMLPYMRDYICKKLRKEYESRNDVLERLNFYSVKEYSSEELLVYMKSDFEANINHLKKTQLDKRWGQMISWLWKNRKTLLGDKITPFYIKTRKNEYKLSTDTYAGIEYSNSLGERLIGKALPDRIICDIKPYLEGKFETAELDEFLRQLGVSYLPNVKEKEDRSWYLGGNNSFKEYVTKVYSALSFPYKMETDVFDSVNDMVNRTKYIYVKHDYVDGLEEILSLCDTSDILEWIRKDDHLRLLLTTHKTINACNVKMTWKPNQNERQIREIKKPYSYVLFLFESMTWLQVGEDRYKMRDCLLSSERVDNLEPVLVEPELSEYLKNIDGPKGKLRSEYTELLKDMGIPRDFADLSVDKIYDVLNLLSEHENTEELAKSFYLSLIRSRREFSEQELNCKKRLDFIGKGKILCEGGYRLANTAFYLDGKDVCNKIADSFNLVCLPKRLNSKRIEDLLGVKKLVLKGKVVGIPKIHEINSFFEKDFRKFLSLAFVYRLEAKEDVKKEARRFGAIEVDLCSEIKVEYNGMQVLLDDYEYILDGSHTYYLKVPEELTQAKIRHNIQLSSAVANIISSYLDVAEVMQKIRELYNAGTNLDREFLICQEFDGDTIINQAKQALNMDEDLRDEFVDIISRLSGRDYDDFEYLLQDIDFENFSEISNSRPFINLFRTLNIDISDYNSEAPAIDIDLRPYYEGEILRILPLYEDKYKWTHYERLKDKSIGEKKTLVANFLSFEDTRIKTENSVWFDCKKAILTQLRIKDDITGINLVNKYTREKSKLKDNIDNLDYFDAFLQLPDNMSLVYYGEIDELVKLYKIYISKMVEEHVDNPVDIPQQKINLVMAPDTLPNPQTSAKTPKTGKAGKKKTGYSVPQSRSDQERTGLLGERLIYNMLMADDSLQKVRWVSENAKKDNVNPEGVAGKGYDIEYIDANGVRKYIEVKTSKASAADGIRFFYSDNEYRFANEHIENYCVYYVCDIASAEPQVLVLNNLFVGDDFNAEKYTLESSSQYTITANLQ